MTTHRVDLRPKTERRLLEGHCWVFSNELQGPAAALPPGGAVDVHAASGRFVGRGYANPGSLIAARILTRAKRDDIDTALFYVMRLREALAYREAVYPARRSLRLVNAESDGLPGLVVDRYDDTLVVQIGTLGMETRLELLQQALQEVFAPRSVVLRNDARIRELEGLERYKRHWFGEAPEPVTIEELGVKFRVDPLEGQKTGHFFDQVENRAYAAKLIGGRSMLDVYAHTGAWAMHALKAGATRAVVVDSSEAACAAIEANGEANGVTDRLQIVNDEGKRSLQQMVSAGMRFGAVVLDPPAFAKTRRTAGQALRGYGEINGLGLALVEPGGFLFTSSCSYHVEEDRFLGVVHKAAREQGLSLRIVRRGEQAPDHPVIPGIPETRYLKSFALQVVAGR